MPTQSAFLVSSLKAGQVGYVIPDFIFVDAERFVWIAADATWFPEGNPKTTVRVERIADKLVIDRVPAGFTPIEAVDPDDDQTQAVFFVEES